MTRKIVVEGIGTFFLMFTIGMVVLPPDSGALGPLAIGAVLMAMIYAGGHISGAHYNPAVTLAVFFRGKCPAADVPGYLIAQVVGGVLAAVVAKQILPGFVAPAAIVPAPSDMAVILSEFLFTFALANTVVNVATAKGTKDNSFYGLAIGSTVVVGAVAVGSISGGVFNPAVFVGVAVFGLKAWSSLALLVSVQLVAGAAAGLLFKVLHPDDN
jgi:aquaporin Z